MEKKMSKVAVVYWSGTGNTKIMADAVFKGAKDAGAEAYIFTSGEFDPGTLSEYSGVAFGCPSMGVEVLEESEFQPMWDECKKALGGKKVALFGSYGWGNGEWMRNWEDECRRCGISLSYDYIICQEAPGNDTLSDLENLGSSIC